MKAGANPPGPGVDIVKLQPLPAVLRWAIERGRDGHDIGALVDAVAHDPALAMRALALAQGDPAVHPERLALRKIAEHLGGRVLYALALRAATDWLRGQSSWPAHAGLAAFWGHSVHCAYLGKALAEALHYPEPEAAYLAGLLHDTGIAAHMAQSPASYRTLLAGCTSEMQLLAREAESAGAGHPEAGEALAAQAGLPGTICDALLMQHTNEGDLVGTHVLVRIVWVAEALADPGVADADRARFAGLLGLESAQFAQACESAARQQREAAAMFGAEPAGEPALWRVPAAAQATPPAGPAPERDAAEHAALLEAILQRSFLQAAPGLLLEADESRDVLARARAAAAAAFGLKNLCYFSYDGGKNELAGWLIGTAQLTDAELRIPARGGASAVARAWTARESVLSLPENEDRPRGVDLQIARLLQAHGLIAVPLVAGSAAPGVAVLGVGREQAARLLREREALAYWARLVATALARIGETSERERGRQGEALERLRLAMRQLVHEARNPLSILKSQLELVRERVRSGSSIDRDVQILKEEIDRVSGILARLGTLEAPKQSPRRAVNINRTLQDLLALYREPLFTERGIAVRLDLAPPAPEVVADPDGLKQVLVNLWKNAAEAMPRGGQLHIAVADRVNYEGRLMVEVTMSDTGSGIAPELLEAVFTQRPARADPERGFGLSNSYAIVRQLGGHIMCRSQAGRGTTFTLLLPRAAAERPESA